MPILREFTQAHPISSHLSIDWTQAEELLPKLVCDAVNALDASLAGSTFTVGERERLQQNLQLWQDDLRRAHLMSNELSIQEFQGKRLAKSS